MLAVAIEGFVFYSISPWFRSRGMFQPAQHLGKGEVLEEAEGVMPIEPGPAGPGRADAAEEPGLPARGVQGFMQFGQGGPQPLLQLRRSLLANRSGATYRSSGGCGQGPH